MFVVNAEGVVGLGVKIVIPWLAQVRAAHEVKGEHHIGGGDRFAIRPGGLGIQAEVNRPA
jgi:hypothetical protein